MTLGKTDLHEINRQKFLGDWPLESAFVDTASSPAKPGYRLAVTLLLLSSRRCLSDNGHVIRGQHPQSAGGELPSASLVCVLSLPYAGIRKAGEAFRMLTGTDAGCSWKCHTRGYSFHPPKNL